MAQLFTTLNPRQPETLRINTIQYPKNDMNFMAVTTQGHKQTSNPPMSSVVEDEMR